MTLSDDRINYLDHAATTPVRPGVLEKMLPYFTEKFGNPSSLYALAGEARYGVDEAREQVAAVLGSRTSEIVFTGGGSESDNLAIKGFAALQTPVGGHIVTTAIEHHAVIHPVEQLEKQGFTATYVGVDSSGRVDPEDIAAAVRPDTFLVSVMLVNNEVGTIQDLAAISKLVRESAQRFGTKVLIHSDVVQAAGKLSLNVDDLGVDLMSLSGHKIYGPKGVGALYVRRRRPRVRLSPQIHGGGHERGNRSGTLNVPGIVGFGEASRIARLTMAAEAARIATLRLHLQKSLEDAIPDTLVNGNLESRLPGTLNISFSYVEGESLLMGLKDIAVSSGSACTSASLEPSYVLRAMGLNDELAHSSLRITIGRYTTQAELDYVSDRIRITDERLREMSPLWEMVQEGIDLNSIEWTAH